MLPFGDRRGKIGYCRGRGSNRLIGEGCYHRGIRKEDRDGKEALHIALEEHYQDSEVKQLGGGPGAGREIVERLDDLGPLGIRELDEAGIDPQVLSHSIPGLQAVDAEAGPPLARRTDHRLYEAVQRRSDRLRRRPRGCGLS
jgi:hypothetical protein